MLKFVNKWLRNISEKQNQFEIYLGGNQSASNILIFTEHINATYYISFDIPLKELHAEGRVNFAVVSQSYVSRQNKGCWKGWFAKFKPDVVVFTRYGHESGVEILRYIQMLDIPAIYHIDDDLLDVPESLGAEIKARQGSFKVTETRRFLLENCNLIYASTRYLSDLMKQRFPNQKVFHGIYAPYMGDRIQMVATQPKQGFVIGYMGSKGHQHDLELVVPALARIMSEREDVSFEVFGTIKMPKELERFGERVRSYSVQKSYEEFLGTLSSLNWDVGLAPLEDASFNLCKAPTKFIEYTASNIPVIASKIPVYEKAVPNNAGLFVLHDWYEAINLYLNNSGLREQSLVIARDFCANEYSINRLKVQILNLIEVCRSH